MMPLETTIGASISKVAIGIIIKSLYSAASGEIKKKLKCWLNEKGIIDFNNKIRSVGKVKTIWQINKPVNIKTFYYPSKLIIDGKPEEVTC